MISCVKCFIHMAKKPMYKTGITGTPRHIGYLNGGYSKGYARIIAREICKGYLEENAKNHNSIYSQIDLAIIKVPGKPKCFFIEDRSEKVKGADD